MDIVQKPRVEDWSYSRATLQYILHDGRYRSICAHGVNLIRVPTTYAAWISVPFRIATLSWKTSKYLKRIVTYAIEGHNMHIVLDIHSLPGSVNFLEIGEAHGQRN